MKVAIPTRNNVVDDHFGHCEYYTIFTISEDKLISVQKFRLLRKDVDVNPI